MGHRLAAGLIAVLAAGVPAGGLALAMWPQSPVYGRVYVHGDRGLKRVALTFDDGPNSPATLDIAAAMEAHGVHGTFFVVGENVSRDAATVRALVDRGHVVAAHSWRHMKRDAIFDFGYEEAANAQRAILDAAGVCTALFRAPNGFHTPWQHAAVASAGMSVVAWDVQTYDWENPPAAEIVADVLDQVEPGSIILLHDGSDLSRGEPRPETIEAVGGIIEALQNQGYEFVTVDELLAIPAYGEDCA